PDLGPVAGAAADVRRLDVVGDGGRVADAVRPGGDHDAALQSRAGRDLLLVGARDGEGGDEREENDCASSGRRHLGLLSMWFASCTPLARGPPWGRVTGAAVTRRTQASARGRTRHGGKRYHGRRA